MLIALVLATTIAQAKGTPFDSVRIAWEAGDADRAVQLGERAVALFPDSAIAHVWLGRAYLLKLEHVSFLRARSMAGKAREQFDRAVALDSLNFDAREARARYFLNAPGIAGGSREKARAEAEVARRINPYRGEMLLSDIAVKDKRVVEAETQLKALTSAYPDSSAPFNRLVSLYQNNNRFTDAFALIDARSARMHDDPSAQYQMGKTAALSGEQLERGESALRAYLASDSLDRGSRAYAHYRLGMILELRKDLNGARAEYEAALRLDASLKDAATRAKRLR